MVKLSPITKVAISWGVIIGGGLYLFYLSKTSIDNKRYENMKIRQRMRQDPFAIESSKE